MGVARRTDKGRFKAVRGSSNALAHLPREPVAIDTGTASLSLETPAGVTLFVNGVPSSFLDLHDPEFLAFEYFQQMDAILSQQITGPIHALHLGAGGCTLARAWDAARPGSRQVAVDVDAKLTTYVREWFDLPRAPRLRLRAGDARDVVNNSRPGSYDVVVRDVFLGDSTPSDFTSLEFAQSVARILKPGGLYLANCAAEPPFTLTRAELGVFDDVFPSVCATSEIGILKGKRYGNMVIAGSLNPDANFESPGLARALGSLPVPARVLSGEDLRRFVGSQQTRAPALRLMIGPEETAQTELRDPPR
jgi:SAM-dependent methyltransferase